MQARFCVAALFLAGLTLAACSGPGGNRGTTVPVPAVGVVGATGPTPSPSPSPVPTATTAAIAPGSTLTAAGANGVVFTVVVGSPAPSGEMMTLAADTTDSAALFAPASPAPVDRIAVTVSPSALTMTAVSQLLLSRDPASSAGYGFVLGNVTTSQSIMDFDLPGNGGGAPSEEWCDTPVSSLQLQPGNRYLLVLVQTEFAYPQFCT
ncbi:MAG TPA: hypothetical protein VMD91_00130 [Candidatus Sulfotelmatobacter sp.]|nr:hypothetical protein [Candidatus Sulfotelmatobacter sp.]